MNIYRPPVDLPVGQQPGWELEDDENAEKLKAVSESGLIYQSLRQSRQKWLTSTFVKFSSRNRGSKSSDPIPSPHTIQNRGRCDLEIGPHIFPDTTFYEVHYLPPQTQLPSTSTYAQSVSPWQSTTSYNSPYLPYGQYSAMTRPAATEKNLPDPQRTSAPLITSLTTVATITPSLISQVNSAASSNPILANLLQLAAAGKASPEQLKTLGLLIQSLASPTTLPAASTSALSDPPQTQANVASSQTPPSLPYATPALIPPVREFDLVIEFRETSSDRWIFPRGPFVCERRIEGHITDAAYDTIITARIPFEKPTGSVVSSPPQATDTSNPTPEDIPPQPVTLLLKKAPLAVWDTLIRWAGGEEKMKDNRKILEDLKRADRVYLGHQLPEGPLLSQLRAAATPTYNMKLLKPGIPSTTRQRRKPAPRKPADGSAPQKSREPPTPTPQAPKRRRVSSAKDNNPATPIQCISCQQTDVPLILGGRFCRPCVDAGKASAAIPQAYRFTPYTSTTNTGSQAVPTTPLQSASSASVFVHSPLGTSLPADKTGSPAVQPQ